MNMDNIAEKMWNIYSKFILGWLTFDHSICYLNRSEHSLRLLRSYLKLETHEMTRVFFSRETFKKQEILRNNWDTKILFGIFFSIGYLMLVTIAIVFYEGKLPARMYKGIDLRFP